MNQITPEIAMSFLCSHLNQVNDIPQSKTGFNYFKEEMSGHYPWHFRMTTTGMRDYACVLVTGTDWDRNFPEDMIELCNLWRVTPIVVVIEQPTDSKPTGRCWMTIHKSQPERFW